MKIPIGSLKDLDIKIPRWILKTNSILKDILEDYMKQKEVSVFINPPTLINLSLVIETNHYLGMFIGD